MTQDAFGFSNAVEWFIVRMARVFYSNNSEKTVVLSYNTNDNRLKIDPLSTITAKVFTVTIQYTAKIHSSKGSQEFII